MTDTSNILIDASKAIRFTFAYPDPKCDNVIFIKTQDGDLVKLSYDERIGWVSEDSRIAYCKQDNRISSGYTRWIYKKDLTRVFDIFYRSTNIMKEEYANEDKGL